MKNPRRCVLSEQSSSVRIGINWLCQQQGTPGESSLAEASNWFCTVQQRIGLHWIGLDFRYMTKRESIASRY
jgi:hypothetical protein